jgi:hypothetical protein
MRPRAHSGHEGESAMNAILLKAAPHVAMIAPRMQKWASRLSAALDAFAEARLRKAIPHRYLLRMQQDLDRASALMQPQERAADKRMPPAANR